MGSDRSGLRVLLAYRVAVAVGFLFASYLKVESLIVGDPDKTAGISWIAPLRNRWVSATVATVEAGLGVAILTRAWPRVALATFVISAGFVVALAALVFAGMPTTACG